MKSRTTRNIQIEKQTRRVLRKAAGAGLQTDAKPTARRRASKKKDEMTTDKLLAIHEAGHAVMAELLSLDPVYVTIELTGMSQGHLRRRGGAITASENWGELLVICAGAIAEGIYSHKVNSRRRLCLGINVEGADGKHLWDTLKAHSDNPRQLSDWYELAYSQAEHILNDRAVRRAVEALADRLLAERTITSGEAFTTIRAGLGRSKWARDQYQMAERYASPPQTWIESREEYRLIEKMMSAYARGGSAK